ncbi:hypothetical protein HDK64DRAFT_4104 [Phyllosticta capitalensis]
MCLVHLLFGFCAGAHNSLQSACLSASRMADIDVGVGSGLRNPGEVLNGRQSIHMKFILTGKSPDNGKLSQTAFCSVLFFFALCHSLACFDWAPPLFSLVEARCSH